LIDQIVRQTTVLLAQLSTAAGIRAPMAHIADQVFLNLAREIEQQGVGRKVAADMFGMALRTYQRRVQRVSESASVRDRTLWEAVLDYLGAEGSRARKDILHRFRWDGEANVAAVLNDLTNSGILYCVGRGEHAVYGLTSEADLKLLAEGQELGALKALLWVHIYRQGSAQADDMAQVFCVDQGRIQRALDEMVGDGRLQGDQEEGYTTQTFLVPVGSAMGWEAAVYDHYQAMAKAVAHKLQTIGARSQHDDRIGGATLSFDIHEDHPQAQEVLGLLERVRAEVNEIWDRVVTAEAENPVPDEKKIKVTFYFGQNVERPYLEDEDEDLHPGKDHEPR
jgi:hypothetical protein